MWLILSIALAALLWALALCISLTQALGRRARAWLVACFAASFLYVILSLQLERIDPQTWLVGLKWGLFTTALFAFLRYRMCRHRSA